LERYGGGVALTRWEGITMNISKMTKAEIADKFQRVVSTYDFNTLVDLFCDRFDTKTKKEWIREHYKE